MNNEDAKLILQAYRPNREDDEIPIFREALAQADHDPALAEWFAEECAFDDAISQKLNEIPVPRDLKSSILIGQRMTQRRFWQKNSALLTLMACIALGIFTLIYSQASRTVPFKQYEQEIAQFTATHHFNPIFKSEKLPEIRSWLAQNRGLPAFDATQSLTQLASIGCQVHDISGQKVSVICFWVNKEKAEAIHLFVVDRSVIKNPPTSPVFQQHGEIATASWSDARHAYVLAGIGDEDYIKKFL